MIYPWAVIGAGPAGIAAVGMLLDSGIAGQDIIWIDPEFAVGDFGSVWNNVQGNTKVNLFLKFLHACKAFSYQESPQKFPLREQDPEQTCQLKFVAEPLSWITKQLRTKVDSKTDFADKISLQNNIWDIFLKESKLQAKNIILAVGCEPKMLNCGLPPIPLQSAMDSQCLKNFLTPEDTIAVFGSSHSAVLAIRNLVENKVKKIINFYRSPLVYAVYYEDWILYDDTGLKGPTAEWAKQYIDGNLLDNLERVQTTTETNIENRLSECDKVIYAIGFKRREHPIIENCVVKPHTENDGIIAPGLFGVGIAFPEVSNTPNNMLEERVGLWKFMDYLQRVLPHWRKNSS